MTKNEKKLALRIGRTIAVRRLQKDLTQSGLAEAIGVEQETISRFERGATMPPLGRLADIADVLACPLETLLRDGSPRLADEAQRIALAMHALPSDADRALVGGIIAQLCERLAQKPR